MKKQFKTALICILIPVTMGIAAGLLTGGSMESFDQLTKPPLSPPGWLFPVVWTLLYIMMGLASFLVLTSDAPQAQIKSALKVYGLQLAFNFFWSFLFFTFERYCLAYGVRKDAVTSFAFVVRIGAIAPSAHFGSKAGKARTPLENENLPPVLTGGKAAIIA